VTASAGAAREGTAASGGTAPATPREAHDAARPVEKPTPARPTNADAASAVAPAVASAAPAEKRLVGWSDTEVMGGHTAPGAFAETLPAELGHHGSAHQYAATMPAELDAQSRPMPFAQTLPVELGFELDPPASRNPRPPGQTG
jgi:hypothetical protein